MTLIDLLDPRVTTNLQLVKKPKMQYLQGPLNQGQPVLQKASVCKKKVLISQVTYVCFQNGEDAFHWVCCASESLPIFTLEFQHREEFEGKKILYPDLGGRNSFEK